MRAVRIKKMLLLMSGIDYGSKLTEEEFFDHGLGSSLNKPVAARTRVARVSSIVTQ